MRKKPLKPDDRWRIIHIKGTPAETIGYVHAPDAEAAIKKAIEEFKVRTRKYSSALLQSGQR
jgi:hypothetical protein